MHGGHEALGPRAAAHVGVAGRQELFPRHRTEQPAERAGKQQRPGSGVDALTGYVHQGDFEDLSVAERHHEVAAERRAAGRLEHERGAPPLAEVGQLALGPDPVPELEQHPVAAQALDAELFPGPRQHIGEDRGEHDGGDDAGPGLAVHHVVDERRRGEGEVNPQRPRPQQQAARQDRQDHHAGREPPLGDMHGRHRDGDRRDREHEGEPAVPGDELPGQLALKGPQGLHRPAPARAGPYRPGTSRRGGGRLRRGNHDAGTVIDAGRAA